jgi:hypothetical protein
MALPPRDERALPPLGNGRERTLSDRDVADRAREEAPESQGAFADEAFGAAEQGAYGDEDYDPSYQRAGDVVAALDPDAALPIVHRATVEREGPGRGLRGGEWAPQEPVEPPDELARKVLDEDSEERRRDSEAIRDDVVDVLLDALPHLRDLTVTVEGGDVLLEGTVRSREERLRAARLAGRVPGVDGVTERLRQAE